MFLVTMKSGPDIFTQLVFASSPEHAKEIAEIRFDCRCIKARRYS
jgi:hypothetical protein